MNKLQLIGSWNEDCLLIEKYIKQKASDGMLQILEAGCGQYWPMDLRGMQYTLTGVDLSKKLVELRKARHGDLQVAIVGDLRYVDLEPNKFDVIYNSYVLEHIDGASSVLERFASWLKPGGLLILRIPDRNSVWGFVTRFTPLWFHVFHHKYIRGIRNPDQTDVGPFPTFHDPVVSRSGIHEYCRKNHFVIKEEYGHGYYYKGLGPVGSVMYVFVRCMSAISLGRLAWGHNDLTYVLVKE